MKKKIIIFVVGVLAGAIITSGVFCVYSALTKTKNGLNKFPAGDGQPPQFSQSDKAQNGQNGQFSTPSDAPGNNTDGFGQNGNGEQNGQNSRDNQNGRFGTPPQMPGDQNSGSNQLPTLPDNGSSNSSESSN